MLKLKIGVPFFFWHLTILKIKKTDSNIANAIRSITNYLLMPNFKYCKF